MVGTKQTHRTFWLRRDFACGAVWLFLSLIFLASPLLIVGGHASIPKSSPVSTGTLYGDVLVASLLGPLCALLFAYPALDGVRVVVDTYAGRMDCTLGVWRLGRRRTFVFGEVGRIVLHDNRNGTAGVGIELLDLSEGRNYTWLAKDCDLRRVRMFEDYLIDTTGLEVDWVNDCDGF